MVKIQTVLNCLETIAPLSYQEDYDNAGLIVGNPEETVKGVLLCLDATENIIQEAIETGCNLIIAHHPIVFGGLKKFNGSTYVERAVIKAIQHNIAIYAAHTNFDNVMEGVNKRIGEKLGLERLQILLPKTQRLKKLYTYVPINQADNVRDALFMAGAGNIGKYDECSFNTLGAGTFRGGAGANPFVGNLGKRHHEAELKIEVIFPDHRLTNILAALREAHPYEEVAYEVIRLENANQELGAGMVGWLPEPMHEKAFLEKVKTTFGCGAVRHTAFRQQPVQKIAVCGGAGSFLLRHAIRQKADVFVTSDFKYHEFFDAEGKLVIADIGHYESEQFTIQLFYDILVQQFTTFALLITKINTNPVNYL